MPRCARQLKQNSCSGALRLAAHTQAQNRRCLELREAAAKTKLFKPIGDKATRRRLVSPRSKTGCAAEDCRRSCRHSACPVRRTPPAPTFFYEHAEIRPARRSVLHNTQFTARLESIFAHGQEGAALQRLRGLTPRHRLIMHTSHTATYTHTHTHTHTDTDTHTHQARTHTRTHVRTHTHTHTHIYNVYIYVYLYIYICIYIYIYRSISTPLANGLG